jgi:hypothetical protein
MEEAVQIMARLKLLPVGHKFTPQDRENIRALHRLLDEIEHWAQIARAEAAP